ncbi:unnamed protein product [Sympodiomycopsis kandeliae]
MPRIPVRTEPYDSPSRQHRHYKNKRDQVLRTLGKASYINSSQFVLLLVTANGTVENYASEAFQQAMPRWLEESGINQQAKDIVLERGPSTSSESKSAEGTENQGQELTDDEFDEGERDYTAEESFTEPSFSFDLSQASSDHSQVQNVASSSTGEPSKTSTPIIQCDDVFGGGLISQQPPQNSRLTPTQGAFGQAAPGLGTSRLKRKALAPLDVNSANKPFANPSKLMPPGSAQDDKFFAAPHSAPLPITGAGRNRLAKQSALARNDSSTNNDDIRAPKCVQHDLRLNNRAERTDFLLLRFSQMQQGMCKTVAKAWIKIIEPKKQTRCPYNRGEEGKPDWWPEGVRHKEPDHLMKPERHTLLLTILRSPKIEVARLRLATAEIVAMMVAEKVSLLMDCYRIAIEEEELRKNGKGDAEDIPIDIKVSSHDGWKPGKDGQQGGLDEEGQRATLGDDSPEVDEKRKVPRVIRKSSTLNGATGRTSKKNRKAAETGDESFDSSALLTVGGSVDLQRSISTPEQDASLAGSGLQNGASLQRSQSQFDPHSNWMGGSNMQRMQTEAEAQAEASRRQVASDAVASACEAGLLYGPGQRLSFPYEQRLQGLNHPMSASPASQFLGYNNFIPHHRLEQIGTMSAPPGQHAQLYPEHALFPMQGQSHQQHPALQHQQQQQHPHHPQQHPQQQNSQHQPSPQQNLHHMSTHTSPIMNVDSFQYPGNFAFPDFDTQAVQSSQSHTTQNDTFDNSQTQGSQTSALGLQGLSNSSSQTINWTDSFDSNGSGFAVNTNWGQALF